MTCTCPRPTLQLENALNKLDYVYTRLPKTDNYYKARNRLLEDIARCINYRDTRCPLCNKTIPAGL